MKTIITVSAVALLTAAIAVPVLAQPGPGRGYGQGMNSTQSGPAMGAGMGQGMGQGKGGRQGGMGPRQGGARAAQNGTPGWTLLTPEERTAHQNAMRQVKTYDDCTKLQAEQRALVETRAKEKGVTLPTPRGNGCENMKARGWIK